MAKLFRLKVYVHDGKDSACFSPKFYLCLFLRLCDDFLKGVK